MDRKLSVKDEYLQFDHMLHRSSFITPQLLLGSRLEHIATTSIILLFRRQRPICVLKDIL